MAEGFYDFTPGQVLTAAQVDDYLMRQAVMRFADATARTTALSGVLVEGMMSYLKDTNTVEVYDGSAWVGVGAAGVAVEFLVIGGGGGGGSGIGYTGGGGGGSHFGGDGYDIFLPTSTNFEVVVGAGGAVNVNGSQSFFYNITAEGGGAGGNGGVNGSNGGNGGGAGGGDNASPRVGGVSTTPVGFDGGDNFPQSGVGPAGGGGGAGGDGDNAASSVAGDGGIGASSSITGSAVLRAGGGGGGIITGTAGSGNDGGGDGSTGTGTAGTANTGGGGGGGGTTGAAGGSGVVILRYPNTYTITLGAGLTGSTATDGNDKVTTITAGSDTVSWS